MIEELNLALSNRCNAKCIWCPTTRGQNHYYDMPWETAKKILDEASANDFPWPIKHIALSENGEGIYNKDFIKIARYAREKFPNAIMSSLSNFGMMTKELSETIIKEKLLDTMTINIDGHDEASYKAVKGISYNSVIRNFKRFMKLRNMFQPNLKIKINVMPAAEYALTVKAVLGHLPQQVNVNEDIPFSNFELTKQSLSKIINLYDSNLDITPSRSGFWAERALLKTGIVKSPVDQSTLNCPMLDRVKTQVFIAPNGQWYPCCLDDNNEIALGNVNDQTLIEIHDSEIRRIFIDNLVNHRFEENGGPCSTVVCCESFSLKDYDKGTKHYEKIKFIPIKELT